MDDPYLIFFLKFQWSRLTYQKFKFCNHFEKNFKAYFSIFCWLVELREIYFNLSKITLLNLFVTHRWFHTGVIKFYVCKIYWKLIRIDISHSLAFRINLKDIMVSEAAIQLCSVKSVLLQISQNSQENTCARVSFLEHVFQLPCIFDNLQ